MQLLMITESFLLLVIYVLVVIKNGYPSKVNLLKIISLHNFKLEAKKTRDPRGSPILSNELDTNFIPTEVRSIRIN